MELKLSSIKHTLIEEQLIKLYRFKHKIPLEFYIDSNKHKLHRIKTTLETLIESEKVTYHLIGLYTPLME